MMRKLLFFSLLIFLTACNNPGKFTVAGTIAGADGKTLYFEKTGLVSDSLLDSITTGGKGVGWLWPWSDERFFAPWQVIKVAPFALSRYTTPYGHQVIMSELLWVWLPGVVLMGLLWWKRR